MSVFEAFMVGYHEDTIKFLNEQREKMCRELAVGGEPLKLPPEQVVKVCRNGKDKTCMFLGVVGVNTCAKGSALEDQVEVRRVLGEYKDKGDNCSGPPYFTPTI